MTIVFGDLIKSSDCLVDLRYATKAACLGDLVRRASKTLGLEMRDLLDAIQHRESLGSTGLGNGIAIPHARIMTIREPYALLACLREPLAFESIDDRPVDIVCLVLLPAKGAGDAQSTLAYVAKRLRDPATIEALRRSKTAQSAYDVISGRLA